jgi:hypothetical protein
MNINFGLMPPPDVAPVDPDQPRPKKKAEAKGRDRKLLYTVRAKKDFGEWLK